MPRGDWVGEEADGVDDVLLADERVGGEAGGHVCRFRRVDEAVDDQERDVDAVLAEFLRGRVCERADGGHAGGDQAALRVGTARGCAGDLDESSAAALKGAGAFAQEHERLPGGRNCPAVEAGHARGRDSAAAEPGAIVGRTGGGDGIHD